MKVAQRKRKRRVVFFLFIAAILVTLTVMNYFHVILKQYHKKRINGDAHVTLENFRCHQGDPTFTEITRPFSALILPSGGHLLERIHLLNTALECFRCQRLLPIKKTEDWNISAAGQLRLIAEWNDSFFAELSNYSQVTTVILPWLQDPLQNEMDYSSFADSSNLLIKEYYESTATDPLCTWIETPGKLQFGYDIINNWTCNRNMTRGFIPRSISLLALNAKPPFKGYYFPSAFPDHFFTKLPRILHSLYIIRSGIVTAGGDVIIPNARIVPYGCFPDLNLSPPKDIQKIPLYDEVFVMRQLNGDAAYHRMAEHVPRVALFLEFLLRNPAIKIVAAYNHGRTVELLSVLGIPNDRVISGGCRAKVIYLPRAITCVFPHFLEAQVVSLHYKRYIKKNFGHIDRNKVVFIRRTKHRYFQNQTVIEGVVEMAAKEYNLSYDVFKDNPLPSLDDTMRMFNAAVMVVAPHGAGLVNLHFSEPGTFVVEGVCNLPHAHLFFQRTAQVLGHRWHGIPSSGGCIPGVLGIVTIQPSVVNYTIRTYLDLWNASAFRNTSY